MISYRSYKPSLLLVMLRSVNRWRMIRCVGLTNTTEDRMDVRNANARARGGERAENQNLDFRSRVGSGLYEAKVLGVTVDVHPDYRKLMRDNKIVRVHPLEVWHIVNGQRALIEVVKPTP